MKVAEITLWPVFSTSSQKIMRKLSWRDSWFENGELNEVFYEGEGGSLAFQYNPNTKRMVPYIIDACTTKTGNTYNDIKEWTKTLDFEFETILDYPNREVIIALHEEQLEEDFDRILPNIDHELNNKSKMCKYFISLTNKNGKKHKHRNS